MEIQTYKTAKEELLKATLPQETKTYKPVSHLELIDLTLNSIHKAGFILDSEHYTSARDGNVANGRFTIKNVADSEMQLQIGWQNSYDKSLSLKFAIGTKILICENGCVSGDYGAFKKKHVGEVQTFTPQAIVEYIKRAGEGFKRIQKEREVMKSIEIDTRTKAELIGRMFVEEQFIKSTQLNIIMNELKNPTHDYKAPNSLWELYNFTTFAMKQIHPSLWMDNHIDAHSFFVEYSGIQLSKSKDIQITSFNQLDMFDEEHLSSIMYGVDNNQ
jgi:hypothetical protein